MRYDIWNANIEPEKVLDTAIKGMKAYFARISARDLARIDSAIASGDLTPEEGGLQRNRALALAAETDRVLAENVRPRLELFLTDPHVRRISPSAVCSIADAVDDARWDHLYEAFFTDIKFGTGGIRGRAVMSVGDLRAMAAGGVDAPFLRGPNLFCDLTLLRLSSAVAKYAADNKLSGAVLGYDSRIGGKRFAELIARLFLQRGLKVYLFAEPCPFPELSYSVVHFGADLGIFISASHNDKRYNGYKLTSATGAQLTNTEREAIYRNYVQTAKFEDVPNLPPLETLAKHLTIIGGENAERPIGAELFDLHPVYLNHMSAFLVDRETTDKTASSLGIGYCAFYGAGSKLVPRLLKAAGFARVSEITYRSINEPDGFFPCFSYTQQPDPGDPSSAKIAVDAFIAEYGREFFDRHIDILIGTDPDADRMGVVVKVPREQRGIYGSDWTLLKADEVWALLLWYRLQKLAATTEGNALLGRSFIAQSHVTSELILELAEKYGLARLVTWVGFSLLAESVTFAWEGLDIFERASYNNRYFSTMYGGFGYEPGVHNYNLGCFEESNGFSILGGPPPAGDPKALGTGGHVRDKDGTLAALLIAEVAAYAKSCGKTLIDLIDDLTLKGGIGLFVNRYRPDPPVGQYEGVNAISRKLYHLQMGEELRAKALSGKMSVAGCKVTRVECYAGKGKYAADADHGYSPHKTFDEIERRAKHKLPDPTDRHAVDAFISDMVHYGLRLAEGMSTGDRASEARMFFFERIAIFPEEGLRFFLSDDGHSSVTLRPSGTSRNLKIYVQLRSMPKDRTELIAEKERLLKFADEVLVDFATQLGMAWQ